MHKRHNIWQRIINDLTSFYSNIGSKKKSNGKNNFGPNKLPLAIKITIEINEVIKLDIYEWNQTLLLLKVCHITNVVESKINSAIVEFSGLFKCLSKIWLLLENSSGR